MAKTGKDVNLDDDLRIMLSHSRIAGKIHMSLIGLQRGKQRDDLIGAEELYKISAKKAAQRVQKELNRLRKKVEKCKTCSK